MQYTFFFVFPYPAGCLHVPDNGSSGHAIDDCARVCSYMCADAWAKSRGRVLAGEYRPRSDKGCETERLFVTVRPEDLVRPSFAHLASIMRSR